MSTTTPRRRPTTTDRPLADVVPLARRSGRTAGPPAPGREDARRRPVRDRPDAAGMAELLVRLTGEVAAGRRPLRQLEPLLAPTLARRLAAGLRPGLPRPAGPPRVVRSLAGPPTPSGAIEATVLIERGGRVTAIAVRLERHHGAWRATELTAPEAGYAPLPTRSNPRAARGFDAFDEVAVEAAGADEVTPSRGSA